MLDNINAENVALRIDFNDEVEMAIVRREDGKYDLTWTDYIINVWTETYEDLSSAMLRAATLARCGEKNWESFRQSEEEFTKVAKYFFDLTVTESTRKEVTK